jgi:hypothetical protein
VLERSEVALPVRIVVRGEGVEGFDFLADRRLIFERQGADTRSLIGATRYAHSSAAKVVECGDFRCFVGGHDVPLFV